jgi:hypothetical protein
VVAIAIDAQVPLDAALEGRARQVAAADERDAQVRGLEAPRLGVERLAARRQLLDLDHAGEESPRLAAVVFVGVFVFFFRLRRLLPVEQRLERAGLRDVQVVARDHPDPGAAPDGRIDRRLEAIEARLLDERGDDGDVGRALEQRDDVARERIVVATGGERRGLAQVVGLAGDDVADAAARIVHVAAKPRDDVDVEVHDGLARRGARVEPDVVAVGRELVVELPLDLGDQGEHRRALVVGRGEPVRGHAPGHDQRVPGGHREAIAERERERVGADPRRLGHLEEHGHARRSVSAPVPSPRSGAAEHRLRR